LPGLANASPSAQDAVGGLTIAVKSSGLTMAYTNVNLATGTTDVRAPVLAIKNSGADAVVMATIPTTALQSRTQEPRRPLTLGRVGACSGRACVPSRRRRCASSA
jgi:hypothetical protein